MRDDLKAAPNPALLLHVSEPKVRPGQAPIERVTGWDTPYPRAFEWEYFPGQRG